jgi:hypothetical protein
LCACPNKYWSRYKARRGTPEEHGRLRQVGYRWNAKGGYYEMPNCRRVYLNEDGTWDFDFDLPGAPQLLSEYLDLVEAAYGLPKQQVA